MSIFKKKYPKNKENKNDYEDVYAGPEEMSRRPFEAVYAGPPVDEREFKCVYAGPGMMSKKRDDEETEEIREEEIKEPDNKPDIPPVFTVTYAGPEFTANGQRAGFAGAPAPEKPAADGVFCPFCGSIVSDTQKFCPECGTVLKKDE